MSQTQTIILVIGGLQGLVLSILLLTDKRVNYASKILGIQCLLIATTFFLPIIVDAGQGGFGWLIGVLVFLPSCYGGITYLYCRTSLTGLSLNRKDLLHLLPLVICYFLNYDILFSPEKALSFVTSSETTLFKHTLTKIVFYGQSVVYAVFLIRMVYVYQAKSKQTLSSYNPDIFKWLWSLIAFAVSIWLFKLLFYFIARESTLNVLADCLLVIMVYFVAIVQWRNPSLFHIEQLATEPEQAKQQSDGLLDSETRLSILNLVQDQVREQALYRNSELTLATLAQQVGVSVHHLSETLNQSGGKNFNQFINEYRVAEVCQKLDQKSQQKLIDLALDAGFSSKSSFNSIFKKITGKTPSQYRQG